MRRYLVFSATALAAAIFLAPLARAQAKTCADFSTQQEAQAYYDQHKSDDPNNPDPYNLDTDGDGKACEGLPSAAAATSTPVPVATTAPANNLPNNGAETGVMALSGFTLLEAGYGMTLVARKYNARRTARKKARPRSRLDSTRPLQPRPVFERRPVEVSRIESVSLPRVEPVAPIVDDEPLDFSDAITEVDPPTIDAVPIVEPEPVLGSEPVVGPQPVELELEPEPVVELEPEPTVELEPEPAVELEPAAEAKVIRLLAAPSRQPIALLPAPAPVVARPSRPSLYAKLANGGELVPAPPYERPVTEVSEEDFAWRV